MPSKKLIYLIAGIGGAALLLFNWPVIKLDSNPKLKIQDLKNQKLAQKLAQEAQKDGDQDGLKDWEEKLWKTDPQNPDTDGDGAADNEEIKQNRDPLKPGPNDELPNLETRSPSEIGSLNPQDYGATNLTRQIAKTLSLQTLIGAENNFTVPDDSKLLDAGAEKTLADFTALFHPRISENELIAINDNSEEGLTLYQQSFKKALDNPLESPQEEIFIQAVQNKDFSGVNQYLTYYQEMIQTLKTTPTPKIIFSYHKRWIELIAGKIAVLENLKEIERDPLKAVIALQEHEKINEEILRLLSDFGNLFQ